MKTKIVFFSKLAGVLLICMLVSVAPTNANTNLGATDLMTFNEITSPGVPWDPLEIQEFEHPVSGVKFTIHFVSPEQYLLFGFTFQKNYNKDTGVCDWSRGGCWGNSSFILPIDAYPYKIN